MNKSSGIMILGSTPKLRVANHSSGKNTMIFFGGEQFLAGSIPKLHKSAVLIIKFQVFLVISRLFRVKTTFSWVNTNVAISMLFLNVFRTAENTSRFLVQSAVFVGSSPLGARRAAASSQSLLGYT